MITIGKYKLNPSTQGQITTYTWNKAINRKILSPITQRNAENFFINILNIIPTHVEVEENNNTRNSYYIYGHINNEPIIIARRESKSPSAGQTKVYSKYAVGKLNFITNGINMKYISSGKIFKPTFNLLPSTKNNILMILKIKND